MKGAFALAAALATAGLSAQAQAPARPVPSSSPFVGTWHINAAKSSYEGIPENERRTTSIRTLDVQAGGLFLQTHRNVSAVRPQSFSYWVGKPDGPEFIEYSRLNGAAPGNRITITSISDRQWRLTFKNQRGEIVLTDTWTVSADGKTLTIDRRGTTPRGSNHSVEVYENEGWAMPGTSRPR